MNRSCLARCHVVEDWLRRFKKLFLEGMQTEIDWSNLHIRPGKLSVKLSLKREELITVRRSSTLYTSKMQPKSTLVVLTYYRRGGAERFLVVGTTCGPVRRSPWNSRNSRIQLVTLPRPIIGSEDHASRAGTNASTDFATAESLLDFLWCSQPCISETSFKV